MIGVRYHHAPFGYIPVNGDPPVPATDNKPPPEGIRPAPRTARVERFPPGYRRSNPPMTLPPLWAAWSDGTGELIAKTTSRIMCMRAARLMHYEPRLFLRAGDAGGVKWRSLGRWFMHWRMAKARGVWDDR